MIKFFNSIRKKATAAYCGVTSIIKDRRGDLATNTIGAIIIAVVIVGLLITAINAFFPGFFTSMFQSMAQKLNANW